MNFPVGCAVTITGLRSRSDLNGKTAKVLGPPEEKSGRVPVDVDNERVLVKPLNLKLAVPAGEAPSSQTASNIDDIKGCVGQGSVAADKISEASIAQMARLELCNDTQYAPLPSSPMWSPPRLGEASKQLWATWKTRNADSAMAEEDEDLECDDGDDYDEEEEAADDAAVDAALLAAARRGTEETPMRPAFAPVEADAWLEPVNSNTSADLI